jgi:hypothetical protein
MREPMTLLEQSDAFNKLNRQRLLVNNQTPRYPPPSNSSLNNVDDSSLELKTLSFDVYTSKHLITTGRSILPYDGQSRLDEILLPSIDKNINHDENRRRRKRKLPSYRKSLFHSYSSNSTQVDLAQITARGTRPESQIITSIIKDDDTVVSFQRHHAPPPSPSDDELGRILFQIQDKNQSCPPTRQSPIEKEGYVPFRLPALNRSARFRRTPMNLPCKDIRSTLSNYLRRYY